MVQLDSRTCFKTKGTNHQVLNSFIPSQENKSLTFNCHKSFILEQGKIYMKGEVMMGSHTLSNEN